MEYVVADHQLAMARLVGRLLRRSCGCIAQHIQTVHSSPALFDALAHAAGGVAVIVDPAIPGLKRVALVRALRWRCASARLIVHAGEDSPFLAAQLLAEGVHGYVFKSSPPQALADAVVQVRAGGRYYDPRIDFARVQAEPWSKLTPKQQAVCLLLLRHGSIGRIAQTQQRNYDTVWNHWSKAKRRLGIEHEAQLAKYFYDRGLIHLLDD